MKAHTAGADGLLWAITRHYNRIFWRNPLGAFFTAVFPLLLLVILGGLFGGEQLLVGERWLGDEDHPDARAFAQVITPAIAAFAIAMAGYVQLATATAGERSDGTLKRVRGTPMPPWGYFAGRLLATVWIALLCAVVVIAAGAMFTEMSISWSGAVGGGVTLLLGAATFAAMGLMLVALVPPRSVQAVAFGTLLPLAFISEVFLHGTPLPRVLSGIAWSFPLRHVATALRDVRLDQSRRPRDVGRRCGADRPGPLLVGASPCSAKAA